MASQSSHEAHTARLVPSIDGEPASGDFCDSSPDLNGEQPESQDPSLQDNLPPQGLNPKTAKEEENNAILGLSFPRKLWRIVEDVAFTSACWNDEEDMVVIKVDLFQMEVLQRRGMDQIFETDSIKSFISELNLYGFSKICPSGHSAGKKMMMVYPNSNFQRDKPLLLQNIQRKGDPGTTAQPAATVATRHSPRLHNQCTQEAGKKVQKGAPPAHRTPSWCSFVFSGLWSMDSVAGRAGRNHLPSKQGGHSGEGTSSNATSVPPATSGRDGAGELPKSPPEYPDYDLVMTLHKTCYSILMVALSVMAPNEAPEVEEERGEPSDYKCVLCEQVKDKPNP
ncbi:hypothetical protein FD754_019907 [Muntiacus muntjak]|uniref:HSF-type DNA-binding domain-containing protein n=1 Tax=Muntiacus muntjak TaxID=9888 RepID=A0A5N3V3F6_MUNMU|nr:hypothetical protein FD754_019907 [Muntiacus muntjak]